MRVDDEAVGCSAEEWYQAVPREILPHAATLARCRSRAEMERLPLYRAIASVAAAALSNPHRGDFRTGEAPARPRYRFVAWNIERGTHLEAQIDAFRRHPYLKHADVLLITEADLGMARSGNRAVAEILARELGMAHAFIPCYIALGKGSGLERATEGENRFGLHGNALLSRYPMSHVRVVPLSNGVDKMAHREKRIGQQNALAARIEFPNLAVETAAVHLDAQSSQRHRFRQMQSVLDALGPGPAVAGGDWNTSTYDSSHAAWAIFGFWLRVMMGVDNVMRNHYLHPERWFERRLFQLLEARGFDYRRANRMGEHTVCYDYRGRATESLKDWVPLWCFPFIRWALRNHGGRCPMKLDWFATRGLRTESPMVIHEPREDSASALYDHDAIGVDILV